MTRVLSGLLAVLVAVPAMAAEDEDDLAPLTPVKPKPAAPAPPPRKVVKPPVPVPLRRPAPASHARTGDDDLAPLVPVPPKGEVLVRVVGMVSGAVLSVDGREVGVLPLEPVAIPVGEHQVAVARRGFAPFARRINVPQGRIELEAKLTPIAGVVSVTSNVPDATVLVDGKPVGSPPVTGLEVPPGWAEVLVTKAGYRDFRQQVPAVAGEDFTVAALLEPLDAPLATSMAPAARRSASLELARSSGARAEPVTDKWYFWVGLGVAVAAVSAATIIGVTATMAPMQRTSNEICGGRPCDGCINLSCTAAAH